MLTQGWVGYDWKDVFYPSANPISYQPETEFTVSGTVTNAFGGAIEKSNVLLFGNKPVIVKDTLTDKTGKFKFTGLFPVDTAIYKLQARNKRSKEFNVAIKIDEIKPPEFKPVTGITPWYVNSDTIRLQNTGTKAAQEKAQANYRGEGNMLRQVDIKAKKVVKGSKNLNGPGEADLIIDEEEVLKAKKMTLSELLNKRLKNYNYWTIGGRWTHVTRGDLKRLPKLVTVPLDYTLDTKKIHFIIDGIDIDYFYFPEPGSASRYEYIKNYLDYYTAEDIKGIEVLSSTKLASKYHSNTRGEDREIGQPWFAFIEITTRTGHGPFMKFTPGTYLHKPLAFTLPKQFYAPKYTVKNKTVAMGTDMRSTIHWEPNIITDKDGKATVSFYSADKPSVYTVTVEGVNVDGGAGFYTQKLKAGDTNP
ncbi:MAG: carboxypeptidase regulatory-like domain-containing protein [Sphingobacteriaceae bacterium]|nr:MAG: carboxypeptidase regulatory-like domain-containing protein [Sphingobacteriaceae bacterium]